MNEHLTEEEQVEKLKKWLKENGTAIIVGVVIGLTTVIGVRYWFSYQEQQAVDASVIYNSYTDAVARKDSDRSSQLQKTLHEDYKNTPYAALAAMHEAKVNIDAKKYDDAIENLEWAVKNPGHAVLAHLARTRLASVLIAQGKETDALQLIKDAKDPAFDATYSELRGDAYLKQGNREMAQKAYQLALATNSLSGKQREFVEMKLSDMAAGEIENK